MTFNLNLSFDRFNLKKNYVYGQSMYVFHLNIILLLKSLLLLYDITSYFDEI